MFNPGMNTDKGDHTKINVRKNAVNVTLKLLNEAELITSK